MPQQTNEVRAHNCVASKPSQSWQQGVAATGGYSWAMSLPNPGQFAAPTCLLVARSEVCECACVVTPPSLTKHLLSESKGVRLHFIHLKDRVYIRTDKKMSQSLPIT